MTVASVPLIDIGKNPDGSIELSLNMKGLKVLASLLVEHDVPHFRLRLHEGKDFELKWPQETEMQRDVREGTIETSYGTRIVAIGHVKRQTAGRMRNVVNVFIDHQPIVQFLASDDGHKMVSVIREPNSKRHVFDLSELPTVYQHAMNLTIESYRLYVGGTKSTTGLAVVCDPEDYETMVRHALLRLGVDVRQRRASVARFRHEPRK